MIKKSTSPLPQELSIGAKQLQTGRVAEAAQTFNQFLTKHPEHAEALHFAGLAANALGQYQDAARLIQKAIDRSPKRAAFYLNLALVFAAQGQASSALAHMKTATQLQPSLMEAWYNLGVLSTQAGELDEAIQCYRKVLTLSTTHLAALNNLAELLARIDQKTEAAELLRRALRYRPNFPDAQYNLARLLSDDAPDEAAHLFSEVTKARPGFIDAHRLHAKALARTGRHQAALALLQQVAISAPNDAHLHNDLGLIQMELGRLDDAQNEFQQTLSLTPQHAHALYNLAFMVKSAANPILLTRINAALDSAESMPDEERALLHFASGHLLESAQEYDQAFLHFQQANQLRHVSYDPAETERYFESIKASFDQAFFSKHENFGAADDVPVFIVGMPRSGTTLVEQIFASHPQAAGAGELIAFNQLANGLKNLLKSSRNFPECIEELPSALAQDLARAYLQELRRRGGAGMLRISDKMPGNFVNLGLIALLFPRAKIIHCQRDALDTCVSCFTSNFTGFLPYTYNLKHLGHYYRQYQSLMAHWERALPQQIYSVQYEQLVADPAQEIPKLIEYIGLVWDERCLSPHQTQRAVSTASNVQVREPIYRRSVSRATRFTPHLSDLLAELSK